jgi:RND superfamily putative drug exporter
MAVPYFTIELGDSGVESLPPSDPRTAYEIIDSEFSAGRIAPTEIVVTAPDVTSPAVQQALVRVQDGLRADGSWGEGAEIVTSPNKNALVMKVFGEGDVTAPPAQDAVRRLRSDIVPQAFSGVDAQVRVGGNAASTVDYIDTMNRWMPIVLGFVLSLSFLLLMVVFRSVVLPVKAIILNLLSVGAAYGAVVAVFQHGWGADLLGLQQSDTIGAFLPIFMFAILFGLSMDYHVFLLSRIQERYHETGDNSEAVAHGMRSTSGIITGAAAIMVVVFGGFAMGDLVAIQQVGFGLAVAVFLDATVVRTLLVPSSMQLLGKWNWYLPSWLGWLPRISVEGAHRPEPQAQRAPTGFDYVPALGGD